MMTVGIRGTSGVIRCENDGVSVMYILDGQVTLITEEEEITVRAGNKAELGEKIVISKLTESEVDTFAIDEIRKDTILQDRIRTDTNLDVDRMIGLGAPEEDELPENIAATIEEIKLAAHNGDFLGAFTLANNPEMLTFLESREDQSFYNLDDFAIGSQEKIVGFAFYDIEKDSNGKWGNGMLYHVLPWEDPPFSNVNDNGLEITIFQITGGDYTGICESKQYNKDGSLNRALVGNVVQGAFTGIGTSYLEGEEYSTVYNDGYMDDSDSRLVFGGGKNLNDK
jgi:hypothetical protein